MYSCFYQSKKFLGCSMWRETCQLEKTTEHDENLIFKALTNRFWLTSKSCSWFKKDVHSLPSIKWTSWKDDDMLLKVDYMCSLLRKSSWKWSLVNR